MTQRVQDRILQTMYGCPHADGYGVQVLDVGVGVQNVNLGRNSMYKLQPKMDADSLDVDGYFAVLDAWNTVVDVETADESPVTDATGEILRHEQDRIIITNHKRHVLSVKMPNDSTATMSLRIIKLEPGFCLDETKLA